MSVKVFIVAVLFASAVSGAVTLALMEGGIEYRTVNDLTSRSYAGERVRIRAQVVKMQSKFRPTRFTAVDIPPEGEPLDPDAPAIQIVYEGDEPPQGLRRAAHVTVEGRYDADRGAFVATMLKTQCPSKYEGEELQPVQLDKKEPTS